MHQEDILKRLARRMREEREEKYSNEGSNAGRNINFKEYMYKPDKPSTKGDENKRNGHSEVSRKCCNEIIAELSRKLREEEDSEVTSANTENGVNVSRNEQNIFKKRPKLRKCKNKLAVDKKNLIV